MCDGQTVPAHELAEGKRGVTVGDGATLDREDQAAVTIDPG
jgi:hypothetical protein